MTLSYSKKLWMPQLSLTALLVASISGCATKVESLQTSIVEWTASSTFRTVVIKGIEFDGAWWSAFNDPTLTFLISRALDNNFDVRVSLERLAEPA